MNNDNETLTQAELDIIGFALLMCPKSTLSEEGKQRLADTYDKVNRIWATLNNDDKVSV